MEEKIPADHPSRAIRGVVDQALKQMERSRAAPAKFLEGYQGYPQADAYSVYDAFFKGERGMAVER